MLRTVKKISNSFHILPITHNSFKWQITPFLVSPKFIVIFKGMKLPHVMRTISQGGNKMAQASWDSLPWPFVWTAIIFHFLSPSSQPAERGQRASRHCACWFSNRPKCSNLSWLLPTIQECWVPASRIAADISPTFQCLLTWMLKESQSMCRKARKNRLWPRTSCPVSVKFCHLLTCPSSFSFALGLSWLSLLHFPGLFKRTKVW